MRFTTDLDESDGADQLVHHGDPLIPGFQEILVDLDTAFRDVAVERGSDGKDDDTGKG